MVQLRFSASDIKEGVEAILKRKVNAVTTNKEVYTELLNTFYYGSIEPTLVKYVDTGAFAYAKGGVSERSGFRRQGFRTISPHHGIERDAVEYRKNGEVHYFRPLIGRIYGIPAENVDAKSIYDAMHPSIKQEFLTKASKIIAKGMNDG